MKATRVFWYDSEGDVVNATELVVLDGRYAGTDVSEGDFTSLIASLEMADNYEEIPSSFFTVVFER